MVLDILELRCLDINMLPHVQVDDVQTFGDYSELDILLVSVMRSETHDFGVSNLVTGPRP